MEDRCQHGMFFSGAGACPQCGGGASPTRSTEELLKVIKDLLEWSEIMGGWESACWDRAREAVGIEDEQLEV